MNHIGPFIHFRSDALNAYLFGDILAVGKTDLWIIGGGVLLVLMLLFWRWSSLLTATLSDELAYASGIQPRREQLVLTLALAVVVAVALKVVGVLLIAALLIIPAVTARPLVLERVGRPLKYASEYRRAGVLMSRWCGILPLRG